MKKSLRILSGLLALTLSWGVLATQEVTAASREEIAKISVKADGSNFKYWAPNSAAKQKLVAFVKDVTNKHSKNYVPVEERIATFDMDGTIIGETTPFYFEWMLYLDRLYNDPSYKAPQDVLDRSVIVKKAIAEHKVTAAIDEMESQDKMTILAGLNETDFRKAVVHAMEQPVPGLTNIKYGETIYWPMMEVLSYLKQNDFQIYIVSGGYRQIVREYARGILPIPVNHIIGADVVLKASNQGNTPAGDYLFQRDKDEIITTGDNLERDDAVAKALKISREIGIKPVLSFGNSMGDASMHEYTLSNKKYKTISFEILCDDVEREYGNLPKAAKVRAACEKYGWVPVSMHDDWQTIYGTDIKKK